MRKLVSTVRGREDRTHRTWSILDRLAIEGAIDDAASPGVRADLVNAANRQGMMLPR